MKYYVHHSGFYPNGQTTISKEAYIFGWDNVGQSSSFLKARKIKAEFEKQRILDLKEENSK